MNDLTVVFIIMGVFAFLLALILSYNPKPKPKIELGESLKFRDLEIGPNDILVAQCERVLSDQQRAVLTSQVIAGVKNGLIITDGGGITFQVIRRK